MQPIILHPSAETAADAWWRTICGRQSAPVKRPSAKAEVSFYHRLRKGLAAMIGGDETSLGEGPVSPLRY